MYKWRNQGHSSCVLRWPSQRWSLLFLGQEGSNKSLEQQNRPLSDLCASSFCPPNSPLRSDVVLPPFCWNRLGEAKWLTQGHTSSEWLGQSLTQIHWLPSLCSHCATYPWIRDHKQGREREAMARTQARWGHQALGSSLCFTSSIWKGPAPVVQKGSGDRAGSTSDPYCRPEADVRAGGSHDRSLPLGRSHRLS